MKRLYKRRKGFTLVEIVLALAIIILIGTVIFGICASIANSFVLTYNIDDSSDYAMLFARGFENSFLATSQQGGDSGTTCTWYVDTAMGKAGVPTLRLVTPEAPEGKSDKDNAVFDPLYMGGDGDSHKWDVLMFYKWDPDNDRVLYRILLKDNRNSTDFTYYYEGGFWVPRFTDRKVYLGASSRNIIIDGEPMNAATLSKYGFSTTKYASQLDDSFKTKINYSF